MVPFQQKTFHPVFILIAIVTPVLATDANDEATFKDFFKSPLFAITTVLILQAVLNVIKYLTYSAKAKGVESERKSERKKDVEKRKLDQQKLHHPQWQFRQMGEQNYNYSFFILVFCICCAVCGLATYFEIKNSKKNEYMSSGIASAN